MKFKGHYILNSIILIPTSFFLIFYIRTLYILLITIPITCISIVAGGKFPDLDLLSKKWRHRNIFFHSLTIPILLMSLSWISPDLMLLMVFYGLATGTHLLGDVRINPSKRKGFYCIVYFIYYDIIEGDWKEKRMNGRNTTIWLLGNFTLSVIILVMYVRWFY